MTEQAQGFQVLLDSQQYETIAQLASLQNRTISDVVQQVVRLGLEALQEQKQQRQEALNCLESLRQEIYQTHGMYPGDIVAEIRAQREKDIEQMLKGER